MTQVQYRKAEKAVHKEDVQEGVSTDRSALRKYQDFFVGNRRLWSLIKYEMGHVLASPMPGAAGYVLRKMLMLSLLQHVGKGVQIGRSVAFRHPGKISIGDSTAIDDMCVLDARGARDGGITIGREVIIARGTALTSKTEEAFIEIGDYSTIGKNCILSSSSGIKIGKYAAIGGDCYFGGGRYRTERTDVPMLKQGVYTRGPVIIGDDCWIGTGVRVLDGITIGRGSIIGAGTVVHKDVPEYTVVLGYQPLKMYPRVSEK